MTTGECHFSAQDALSGCPNALNLQDTEAHSYCLRHHHPRATLCYLDPEAALSRPTLLRPPHENGSFGFVLQSLSLNMAKASFLGHSTLHSPLSSWPLVKTAFPHICSTHENRYFGGHCPPFKQIARSSIPAETQLRHPLYNIKDKQKNV